MQYTTLALASLAVLANGNAVSNVKHIENEVRSSPGCPAIWSTIASDLRQDFSGCNNNARSAIRFAFHDGAGYSVHNPVYAPASGGADGSLLLNPDEVNRRLSAPMQSFRPYLLDKFHKYQAQNISAADLVQFAAAIAIRSCPGGPVVPTVVGRKDTSVAAPDGNLPNPFGVNATASTILQLFADKGISARELSALLGAHTVSKAVTQFPPVLPGASQDTTPTVWDINYFTQTLAKFAPFGVGRFDSDVNLANDAASGSQQAYKDFGGDASVWAAAFSPAMAKLGLLGIPKNVSATFVDCTALL